MTQYDLGIGGSGEYEDDGYEKAYLSSLKAGDIIQGEVFIGDVKEKEIRGKPVNEFYVIVTNHDLKKKWLCGITASIYNNEKTGVRKLYGEKGGRTYHIVDSLNHVLNKKPRNEVKSHSLAFDTFRGTVNDGDFEKFALKAIPSNNANATAPAIEFITVVKEDGTVLGEPLPETKATEEGQAEETPVKQLIKNIATELEGEGTDPTMEEIISRAAIWVKNKKLNRTNYDKLLDNLTS